LLSLASTVRWLEEIEQRIAGEVGEAVDFALASSPPDPSSCSRTSAAEKVSV